MHLAIPPIMLITMAKPVYNTNPMKNSKLFPPNSQEHRRKLAELYQTAFNAEAQQRIVMNGEIQKLRRLERELKQASQNYAEFDQELLSLN